MKTVKKQDASPYQQVGLETSNTSFFDRGVLKYIPFLLLAIFPLFWQIEAIPIRQWDEARLAMNAAEMIDNGKLIVTYFGGVPDMWNSKPPLQIWLMALSIKALGYTELAVRLPSILAAVATFALLFWFCRRVFNSGWIGVFAVLVLVTSQGYSGYHVARNGDYDALLVFFSTAYLLLFFLYFEQYKPKHLIACGLAIALAVLTKGVAGLMSGPILLLYVLYRRKLIFLLKQPSFYVAAAIAVLLPATYYILRELQNPGYLDAVYMNELGGRYLEVLDGNQHPWNWYLELMQDSKFLPWFYILPLSTLLLLIQPSALYKRFTLFSAGFIIVFLLVISAAKTKLWWYDAPIYPMAALVIAIALVLFIKLIYQKYAINNHLIFTYAITLMVFWGPYKMLLDYHLMEKAQAPTGLWESFYGPALEDLSKNYPQEKNVVLITTEGLYNAALSFYIKGYEKQGYTFKIIPGQSVPYLGPNEVIMTCNEEYKNQVEAIYDIERLYSAHTCLTFRIISRK